MILNRKCTRALTFQNFCQVHALRLRECGLRPADRAPSLTLRRALRRSVAAKEEASSPPSRWHGEGEREREGNIEMEGGQVVVMAGMGAAESGQVVKGTGVAAASSDVAAVEGAGKQRGEWCVGGGEALGVSSEVQSASGSDIAGYHVADFVDDAGDAFVACHGEQAKILENSQYTVAV